MKSKLRSAVLVPSLAAVLVVGRVASAQTQTLAWTGCSVGAFQSCNSLQLSTMPVYSGTTRVGTNLTITMHNLNGQSADDNTAWSALSHVTFRGAATPFPGVTQSAPTPLNLSGGANGSDAIWNMTFAGTGISATPHFGGNSFDLIGGCTSAYFDPATGHPNLYNGQSTAVLTCGPDATASLSATVSLNFDAWTFTSASFEAWGLPVGSDVHYVSRCTMLSGTGGPASCETLAVDVVPEPVTIALLGTGLFGIGAARLRRRKKNSVTEG